MVRTVSSVKLKLGRHAAIHVLQKKATEECRVCQASPGVRKALTWIRRLHQTAIVDLGQISGRSVVATVSLNKFRN